MKKQNPLHRLVCEATGAKAGDVPLIENIMREEIFHSTLDWQTREQLIDGAKQAVARLNEDREVYEYGRASAWAVFQQMRTSGSPHPQPLSHLMGEGSVGFSPAETKKVTKS